MAESLTSRLRVAAQTLLGVSAYATKQPMQGMALDDDMLERLRESIGGNIQGPTRTKTEWFLADLQEASIRADQGNMLLIAQLWKACRADGLIGGLRETRSAGLVALPKRFRGAKAAIDALTASNGTRSVFDEMFPPSELALLADDGLGVGVGVAELVPVQGREHPVMVRLDPEYLVYLWSESRWYFRSLGGLLPITPGDGRWVLHTPGGRLAPWQGGIWRPVGRAYVIKDHAILHRGNFSGKLANPARVAYAPNAATEEQRLGFLQRLIAWGLNSVFAMPPGWDAKLLESNGRGWEVFGKEIETADNDAMIALAGQLVTVTGGTGFANAGIHDTIRADLIQRTGDGLAYTINTQGIPPWQLLRFGEQALDELVRVAWDTARPVERASEATSLQGIAKAIEDLRRVLAASDRALDVDELVNRFGVPVADDAEALALAKAAAVQPAAPSGDAEELPDADA